MARTREFDIDEVLNKAMRLFWSKGYEATSMVELEQTLGINKFSIYNTFGNKQGLYLASLNHYEDNITNQLIRLLTENESGLEAIEKSLLFLENTIARQPGIGCFLLNSGSELGPLDAKVSAKVQNMERKVEDAYYHALTVAQQKGEISNNLNLQDFARFLLSLNHGLITVAKLEQNMRTARSSLRFVRQLLENISCNNTRS